MTANLELLLEIIRGDLDFNESQSEEALSLLEVVLQKPQESILNPQKADRSFKICTSSGQMWLVVKTVYIHTFAALVRETPSGNRAICALEILK